VKIVSEMTYNLSNGMLNPTHNLVCRSSSW